MLSAGAYRIDYRFLVHPFLECDEQVCHWNLRLADSHLPYRRLEVRDGIFVPHRAIEKS